MKITIIVIVALAVGFGLAWLVLGPSGTTIATPGTETPQQYTCGMHPEIISDEPGYCPLCSMKLTPKKDGVSGEGSVKIDPTTAQNMGLVTVAAEYRSISRSVEASGRVAYSEPDLYSVNLKVSGWVERLFVDREGEVVFQGQPLMEIYSPELVATQRELLIARNSGMKDLEAAARRRLANWDISPDQIETLLETGEPARTMKLRAPADGVIVAKNISEGDRLKAGTEVYRLADLSRVWVVAGIYEPDVPFIKIGQRATVRVPNFPGTVFEAEVSYVAPYLNSAGQVDIRLEIDNTDRRLKPDMYAEVAIQADLTGQRLALPRSAVINSGKRSIVYVAAGDGSYRPQTITTGVVGDGDWIEVLSGLAKGEAVVVNGQFLIDSESRLSEALGAGASAEHQHHGSSMSGAADEKEHDGHAGHDTAHSRTTDNASGAGIYTCPMPIHYHVLQYGPGDCVECGMDLVPLEETDNSEVYACPMDVCQVVQDGPGRCPKCGMNLEHVEAGGSHDK